MMGKRLEINIKGTVDGFCNDFVIVSFAATQLGLLQ